MGIYSKIKTRINENELLKDSFWALLGNVFGKGLSFAAGIFIARLLGKNVFGEYGILRNTVVSISILSTFGLGYTATKFIADTKGLTKHRIVEVVRVVNQTTWLSGGFLTLAVWLFANEIATFGLDAPHLSMSLRIVALWILFNALTTTQTGVLSGLGKFKTMAKWNAVTGFVVFLSSICLTYYFGLNGALLGLLFSQIINWIVFSIIIKVQIKAIVADGTHAKKKPTNFGELIKFSIPVAMQEFSYSILTWLTSVLFIRISNYSEFGVFSAGVQVSSMILFIPGILRNVFLSHLSSSINDYDSKKTLKHTTTINIICTIVPVIFVLVFPNIIEQLYGPGFPNLGGVIILLSLNTIPLSVINVYNQFFISKGKNWQLFWLKLAKDLLIILIFIVLDCLLFKTSEALALSFLMINTLFLYILILWSNKENIKNNV